MKRIKSHKATKEVLVCKKCGSYTEDKNEIKNFTDGNFYNKCPVCGEFDCIELKSKKTKE